MLTLSELVNLSIRSYTPKTQLTVQRWAVCALMRYSWRCQDRTACCSELKDGLLVCWDVQLSFLRTLEEFETATALPHDLWRPDKMETGASARFIRGFRSPKVGFIAYCSHGKSPHNPIWGFPKIRGTILGVPIIRTIVFGGLYWGPPI